MKGKPDRPSPLDADHAAFIQGGVSVIVASRDADFVADVVRGCGCRVSRDRRQVTVLVEPSRAGTLLDGHRRERPGRGGLQPAEHAPHDPAEGQ